jgi:hypothetical protein
MQVLFVKVVEEGQTVSADDKRACRQLHSIDIVPFAGHQNAPLFL